MNNTLSYKGYRASLDFDPEDRILIGRVLDIHDVIGSHGASVTDLETAFHEAIDNYLDACAKLEQEPEKPASGRMMLRVDPVIHAASLRAAARTGQSLNKWAEDVFRRASR